MDPTGESSSLVVDSGAHYGALPRSPRCDSLGPSPNECAAIEEILSATEQRRRRETRVLLGALFFCFIFMIVELVFGILAHSLALLTDASHLLIDVGSYTLSIMSLRAAARGACRKYSYGWHRAEVIGTLVSVFSIWGLVAWISIEALTRAWNIIACSRVSIALLQDAVKLSKGGTEMHGECKEINSALMILVGVIGMVVNIVCAGILYYGGSHGHSHLGGAHHEHDHSHSHEHSKHEEHDHSHSHEHGKHEEHDHSHSHGHSKHEEQDEEHDHDHSHSHGENEKKQKRSKGVAVHAALLHALGDCVQSVGVILAGVFIFFSNRLIFNVSSYRYSIYNLADPVCSLIFAVITLYMTKSLIGDLLGILMESTPPGIDYDALKDSLLSISGVMSIHDLHVWSLSSDYLALSVHIVADDAEHTLQKAQYVCETLFGINHTTIQVDTVENGSDRCQAVCA